MNFSGARFTNCSLLLTPQYYDQNKTAEIEFNFEKSLDTQTQVLVVVSVLGLLWLFCIWQVCCYPALRLCGWYCAYWGTIVRMAFDACRGIDPRE